MSDQLDAKLKTLAGPENSFSVGQLYELMEQQEKRIAELAAALKGIAARAAFEQEQPTGLHMTCLSLIEKDARKALDFQK